MKKLINLKKVLDVQMIKPYTTTFRYTKANIKVTFDHPTVRIHPDKYIVKYIVRQKFNSSDIKVLQVLFYSKIYIFRKFLKVIAAAHLLLHKYQHRNISTKCMKYRPDNVNNYIRDLDNLKFIITQ